MDWSILAPSLEKFGVPILKTAITMGVGTIPIVGGILGPIAADAVGGMLASAFGTDATPAAVNVAIAAAPPDVAAAKLAQVNAEAVAKWPALAAMAEADAKVDIADIQANKDVMVAQIASADMIPEGGWKTFLVIANAIWRPLFALEFLVECAYLFFGGVTGILHAIAAQQYSDIDQITKLMPLVTLLLLPYLAARFGILGYHMKLRTNEKEMAANVATGEAPGGAQPLDPKMLANIIKAVTGGKK
jgi:hypothetical protein